MIEKFSFKLSGDVSKHMVYSMCVPPLNEVTSEIADDFAGQTDTNIMPGHSRNRVPVYVGYKNI